MRRVFRLWRHFDGGLSVLSKPYSVIPPGFRGRLFEVVATDRDQARLYYWHALDSTHPAHAEAKKRVREIRDGRP